MENVKNWPIEHMLNIYEGDITSGITLRPERSNKKRTNLPTYQLPGLVTSTTENSKPKRFVIFLKLDLTVSAHIEPRSSIFQNEF